MVSIRLTLFMEHNNDQMLDFFRCALYRKSINQVAWIWQWQEQIYLQTCVYIQRFVQSDITAAHFLLNSQCNVQINIQVFILNPANCIHDLIEDIVCLFFPVCVCLHAQCVRIHNVVWEEEIGRRGEIGSSGEKKVQNIRK